MCSLRPPDIFIAAPSDTRRILYPYSHRCPDSLPHRFSHIIMGSLDMKSTTVEACTEQRLTQHSGIPFHDGLSCTQAGAHDLYWSVGDSGPQEDPDNHGQNPDDLHGTIVRIQVPTTGAGYDIPPGNYLGGASSFVFGRPQ